MILSDEERQNTHCQLKNVQDENTNKNVLKFKYLSFFSIIY